MHASRHLFRSSNAPFHRFIHRSSPQFPRHFSSKPRPLSVLLDIPARDTNRPTFRRRDTAVARSSAPTPEDDIELFDAIVHDGVPVHKIRAVVAEACVHPDGTQANIRVDEAFSNDLSNAYESRKSSDAFRVLQNIVGKGLLPTASAYIRVVEIVASAGDFELAESILQAKKYRPYIGKYQHEQDVQRSAVTSIALAYLSAGLPRASLCILGWNRSDLGDNIDIALEGMNLGFCQVAWGCLIRALTKSGSPSLAVDVAQTGFKRGVASSPSLIFFMLEALRGCGRWKDADALLKMTIERSKTENEVHDHIQERLVGSVLMTLTAPGARRFVDPNRVIELTNSIPEPTLRFRTVSLIALSAVGKTDEARTMYDEIVKMVAPDKPDERAASILVGGFSACIDIGPPEDTLDVGAWYDRICAQVDETWKEYQATFPDTAITKKNREARARAFQRVLWTKSRSSKAAECVDELEKVCNDKWLKRSWGISNRHFAAILSGTELTCDTDTLSKVVELMEREHIAHDARTLAFMVGTLLGAGDARGALREVRKYAPSILTNTSLAEERDYRVSLLLRRLEMLREAVDDRESRVEIMGVCEQLKEHLGFMPRGWAST